MTKECIRVSIIVFLVFIFLYSCRNEKLIEDTNAKLQFSTDTITFDTVFTTFGSTTKNFRIYNKYHQPIKISSIHLSGGDNSNFRLNIDGIPKNNLTNIEIPAKDSLYVFVEVTVDPNAANAPILISDSVVFITNGNIQDVKLIAWGQDVHFYNNEFISEDVWTADKPYLIYNIAYLDSGKSLTINAGTKVYLHKNAVLFIAGKLEINGNRDSPVVFSGDRLEKFYDDKEGQWNRILFYNGSIGDINYAEIKNGIIGLQAGYHDNGKPPTIHIKNTIIHNMSAYGIYSVTSYLNVFNTQISNAQFSLLNVEAGGEYNFFHCTLASYNSAKNIPSVILFNETTLGITDENNKVIDTLILNADLTINFKNSIIYGPKRNEFFYRSNNVNNLDFSFDHTLLKIELDSFDITDTRKFQNNIYNKEPKFINNKNDFRLDSLSPAINKGSVQIVNQNPNYLNHDILGNSRINDSKPDLGAFEFILNDSVGGHKE